MESKVFDYDDGNESEGELSSNESTSWKQSDSESESSEQISAIDCDGISSNQYMTEVEQLCKGAADVCVQNALLLNIKYQEKLIHLLRKMNGLLNICRTKQENNRQNLVTLERNVKVCHLRGASYMYAPFFKDLNGIRCQYNNDYKRRVNEGEVFPMDLHTCEDFMWTEQDQELIKLSIKQQVAQYLEIKAARLSSWSEIEEPSGLPSKRQTKKKGRAPTRKCIKEKASNIKELIMSNDKMDEVLRYADEEFEIDWAEISSTDLKGRHSANACQAMWNLYLRPGIKIDPWTEQEQEYLTAVVEKHKCRNWQAIASEMDGRSDYQCFKQYENILKSKKRADQRERERWTKEEDSLLLRLIEESREGNIIPWNNVVVHFPKRTKKQCFYRYAYCINPSIRRDHFTDIEDCVILAAVTEYGENFNLFPKNILPNRTLVQIRNRYYNSIKHREINHPWSPSDDRKLLELIDKYGTKDWKSIAAEITSHSRTSCRTRYLTVSKILKSNPNATVDDFPRRKRLQSTNVTKNNWVEKICEIATQDGRKQKMPPPPKRIYRFRLRLRERMFYDFLKYSYDYHCDKNINVTLNSLNGLKCVCRALDFPFRKSLRNSFQKQMIDIIFRNLLQRHDTDPEFVWNKSPKSKSAFHLPPNYCSLLAFRAIAIQSAPFLNKIINDKTPSHNSVETAKEIFRKRLSALLYTTTVLNKIDPEDIPSGKANYSQTNTNLNIMESSTEFFDSIIEEVDPYEEEQLVASERIEPSTHIQTVESNADFLNFIIEEVDPYKKEQLVASQENEQNPDMQIMESNTEFSNFIVEEVDPYEEEQFVTSKEIEQNPNIQTVESDAEFLNFIIEEDDPYKKEQIFAPPGVEQNPDMQAMESNTEFASIIVEEVDPYKKEEVEEEANLQPEIAKVNSYQEFEEHLIPCQAFQDVPYQWVESFFSVHTINAFDTNTGLGLNLQPIELQQKQIVVGHQPHHNQMESIMENQELKINTQALSMQPLYRQEDSSNEPITCYNSDIATFEPLPKKPRNDES